MSPLDVRPAQGTMTVNVTVDLGTLGITIPEAAGPSDRAVWFPTQFVPMNWEQRGDVWHGALEYKDVVAWSAEVTSSDDYIDIGFTLENPSDKVWESTLAFTCINPGSMNTFRDYETKRTYVRRSGKFRSLLQIPRKISSRPPVQLFSVPGAPLGMDIPFVAGFDATPVEPAEPLLAIVSHDKRHVLAVATDRPYFLFQNCEYSCIHSCPTMGRLEPGQQGTSRTRVYLLRDTPLDEFYKRYRKDFPNNPTLDDT